MNCNKSFKRDMLVNWGMKELLKTGATLEEVQKTIAKMMKKSIAEVKTFVNK